VLSSDFVAPHVEAVIEPDARHAEALESQVARLRAPCVCAARDPGRPRAAIQQRHHIADRTLDGLALDVFAEAAGHADRTRALDGVARAVLLFGVLTLQSVLPPLPRLHALDAIDDGADFRRRPVVVFDLDAHASPSALPAWSWCSRGPRGADGTQSLRVSCHPHAGTASTSPGLGAAGPAPASRRLRL